MQTITDKLIASKENGIGWITFNNPARHNAVSLEMWQALTTSLEAFAADPDVRVIILKGAGEKAFVAGADISQFKEKRSSPEAVEEYNATADRAGSPESRAIQNSWRRRPAVSRPRSSMHSDHEQVKRWPC